MEGRKGDSRAFGNRSVEKSNHDAVAWGKGRPDVTIPWGGGKRRRKKREENGSKERRSHELMTQISGRFRTERERKRRMGKEKGLKRAV